MGEPCWRHWVAFRLEWACTGLVAWPEHDLSIVLGNMLDRLTAPPREEAAEPETDPLLRAVAEDQRLVALDQRLEQGRRAAKAARPRRPLTADQEATRERWARWRQNRGSEPPTATTPAPRYSGWLGRSEERDAAIRRLLATGYEVITLTQG
jgi:hypothetical protein